MFVKLRHKSRRNVERPRSKWLPFAENYSQEHKGKRPRQEEINKERRLLEHYDRRFGE
jgi:hypothetical protein